MSADLVGTLCIRKKIFPYHMPSARKPRAAKIMNFDDWGWIKEGYEEVQQVSGLIVNLEGQKTIIP